MKKSSKVLISMTELDVTNLDELVSRYSVCGLASNKSAMVRFALDRLPRQPRLTPAGVLW